MNGPERRGGGERTRMLAHIAYRLAHIDSRLARTARDDRHAAVVPIIAAGGADGVGPTVAESVRPRALRSSAQWSTRRVDRSPVSAGGRVVGCKGRGAERDGADTVQASEAAADGQIFPRLLCEKAHRFQITITYLQILQNIFQSNGALPES